MLVVCVLLLLAACGREKVEEYRGAGESFTGGGYAGDLAAPPTEEEKAEVDVEELIKEGPTSATPSAATEPITPQPAEETSEEPSAVPPQALESGEPAKAAEGAEAPEG